MTIAETKSLMPSIFWPRVGADGRVFARRYLVFTAILEQGHLMQARSSV